VSRVEFHIRKREETDRDSEKEPSGDE